MSRSHRDWPPSWRALGVRLRPCAFVPSKLAGLPVGLGIVDRRVLHPQPGKLGGDDGFIRSVGGFQQADVMGVTVHARYEARRDGRAVVGKVACDDTADQASLEPREKLSPN